MHWHILRGDQLRASVTSRAGAVLSTNALAVAGIALALSLQSQRPNIALVTIALATLTCVAFSVSNAELALVSVQRWHRQFGEQGSYFLYSYSGIDGTSNTFEAVKQRVAAATLDDLLEFALVELWRCGFLHDYRYRKLRISMRWLLAVLVLFMAVGAASALR